MEPIVTTFDGGTTFGAVAAPGKAVPARLFKIKPYPEKNFDLTIAEADEMIARFQRAPVLVNHRLSDFNKPDLYGIGTLESITRHGDEIYGAITFSAAAAHLLKGAERKLSLGFTKMKNVGEVSLVLDSHVDNALVLHAFGMDEPVVKPPVVVSPPERKGPPMKFPLIGAFFQKQGATADEAKAMSDEIASVTGFEAVKTELETTKTQLAAKDQELAALKGQVTQIGSGVGATFAKTSAESVAKKYLTDRKIGQDELAETTAAFEAAFAGATFGAEEPAAVKTLKAMLDKRPALADPTVAHFGGAESPNGRQSSGSKDESFDAIGNFNSTGGKS